MHKKMKRYIIIMATAILAGTFFSCKDDSLEKQRQNELKRLDEFIRVHYTNAKPKPSGLYLFPQEEGIGDSIKISDKVQIFFTVMTLDSSLVDYTGRYEPSEVVVLHPTQLTSSAKTTEETLALHEALTYMKKGSKAVLVFNSALGFGQYGSYNVGGFRSIIMELEVFKVFPANPSEEEEKPGLQESF